jgi:hypothetical protein
MMSRLISSECLIEQTFDRFPNERWYLMVMRQPLPGPEQDGAGRHGEWDGEWDGTEPEELSRTVLDRRSTAVPPAREAGGW